MRRLLPAFALLLGQCLTSYMPSPGNAPGYLGGPRRASPGGSFPPVAAGAAPALDAATSMPLFHSGAWMINNYTTPLFVTDVPRGPASMGYSTTCFFFVCGGDGDGSAHFTDASRADPLVAVHSVDVNVQSFMGRAFVTRFIRINGWTRKSWEKEFGKAPNARFQDRVRLKDGQEFLEVKLVESAEFILIIHSDGTVSVIDRDQVEKSNRA